MLWVAWLIIAAENKLSDDETLLMKHWCGPSGTSIT